MPALHSISRLILAELDQGRPRLESDTALRRRPRRLTPKRVVSWITGVGLAAAIVVITILAGPGIAHARPRSQQHADPGAALGPGSTPAEPGTLSLPSPGAEQPGVAPSPSPSPQAAVTRPYVFVRSEQAIFDATRSTPARGSIGAVATRRLRSLVLTPVGVTRALPAIVFGHGYASEPEIYLPLLESWAAAGYLVVAPKSPGSARDLPGTPVRDISGQAAGSR